MHRLGIEQNNSGLQRCATPSFRGSATITLIGSHHRHETYIHISLRPHYPHAVTSARAKQGFTPLRNIPSFCARGSSGAHQELKPVALELGEGIWGRWRHSRPQHFNLDTSCFVGWQNLVVGLCGISRWNVLTVGARQNAPVLPAKSSSHAGMP